MSAQNYQADLEITSYEDIEVRTYGEVHLMPSDPTCEQRMKAIEASGSLDFWDDAAENIYTESDGEPA